MSVNFKKLTGKNPKDFEPVAFSLINNPDVELFAEVVQKDDFLFDFVKQNVINRLQKVCNSSNYLNLLEFMKYYSPTYEEFIVSNLAKYADEDLTDKMLNIFEIGSEDEKTYCAKFFSYIQDPLAVDLLKKYAFDENSSLASNCAQTLGVFKEKSSFNLALEKLDSDDDFEKLASVKFLVSYGDVSAVDKIVEASKTSAMSENIASEVLYLIDWFTLYEKNNTDALFILNLIVNAFGEITELCQVFDYNLYEIFEYLKNQPLTSEIAVVLLNARDKFFTLTENDEYLYDESKEVKQEVNDIKNLLALCDVELYRKKSDGELDEKSLFVFTALDLSDNIEKIRSLLTSANQTVILKALEVLKFRNVLCEDDKKLALIRLNDVNLKSIAQAM